MATIDVGAAKKLIYDAAKLMLKINDVVKGPELCSASSQRSLSDTKASNQPSSNVMQQTGGRRATKRRAGRRRTQRNK